MLARKRLRGARATAFIVGVGWAAAALSEGSFLGPRGGASLEAGSTLEVRWSAPCPDPSGATEAELLLSLDGGLTFPVRVTPELTACARTFRWQVPNLPTAHARLALRAGTGENTGSERLDLVSAEFTILADEDDAPEPLVRGAREWWTRQAVTGSGAEELPVDSMRGEREVLVAADSSPDASEPSPQCLHVPRTAVAAPATRTATHCLPSDAVSCVGGNDSIPLRL